MILLAVCFPLCYFKLSGKGKIIKIHVMVMLSFGFQRRTLHIDAFDLGKIAVSSNISLLKNWSLIEDLIASIKLLLRWFLNKLLCL